MITDPKTIPSRRVRPPGLRRRDRPARGAADRAADDRVRDEGRRARRAGARLRGAAAARADRRAARSRGRSGVGSVETRRARRGAAALGGAVAFVSLLVVAGIPARSSAEATVLADTGRATPLARHRAGRRQGIAPIDDAHGAAHRPRRRGRPRDRVGGACGAVTASAQPRARTAPGSPGCGGRSTQPRREARSTSRATRSSASSVSLEPARGPGAADVVPSRRDASSGDLRRVAARRARGRARRFTRTFELVLKDGRYLITAAQRRGGGAAAAPITRSDALGGVRLQRRRRAGRARLQARGAFRFGVTQRARRR